MNRRHPITVSWTVTETYAATLLAGVSAALPAALVDSRSVRAAATVAEAGRGLPRRCGEPASAGAG